MELEEKNDHVAWRCTDILDILYMVEWFERKI
jgi:hypothetical protein